MRILYVITSATEGGAQKYVLELARHFHGEIAAGTESQTLFSRAEKQAIPSYRLRFLRRDMNPMFDVLAFFELFFLIRKIRPDIVHLNSSKAGILGSLAAKLAGKEVIFTAHGYAFNQPWGKQRKRAFIFFEKIASLFRDMTIAVSAYDKETALKHNVTSENKIVAIPNGIPPLQFLPRETARTHLGIPQTPANTFIFGCVSQYYTRKGLDLLIEAAAALQDSKASFVLIGSGPLQQQLENAITERGLQHTIHMAGEKENAWQYMQAFDGFVLPSRIEGFSFALLEAMQAGLPIIATDVGGNREALGSPAAGIIIPANNTLALTDAITKVMSGPELRKRLGAEALARSRLFTLQNMLVQTQKMYERVLKQPTAAAAPAGIRG